MSITLLQTSSTSASKPVIQSLQSVQSLSQLLVVEGKAQQAGCALDAAISSRTSCFRFSDQKFHSFGFTCLGRLELYSLQPYESSSYLRPSASARNPKGNCLSISSGNLSGLLSVFSEVAGTLMAGAPCLMTLSSALPAGSPVRGLASIVSSLPSSFPLPSLPTRCA